MGWRAGFACDGRRHNHEAGRITEYRSPGSLVPWDALAAHTGGEKDLDDSFHVSRDAHALSSAADIPTKRTLYSKESGAVTTPRRTPRIGAGTHRLWRCLGMTITAPLLGRVSLARDALETRIINCRVMLVMVRGSHGTVESSTSSMAGRGVCGLVIERIHVRWAILSLLCFSILVWESLIVGECCSNSMGIAAILYKLRTLFL